MCLLGGEPVQMRTPRSLWGIHGARTVVSTAGTTLATLWEAEGVRGRGVLAARARLGLAESFRRAADSARIRGGGATTTQSRTMMTKFRPRDAFWVQYRYKRQYATSIGAGPRDNSDSKVWNTRIKERSYAASSPGSQPIEFRPVATEAMGVGSNVAT